MFNVKEFWYKTFRKTLENIDEIERALNGKRLPVSVTMEPK